MQPKPIQIYLYDGSGFFWRNFFAPFRPLSCPCKHCDEFGRVNGSQPSEEEGVCKYCLNTGQEQTKVPYLFAKQLTESLRSNEPDYATVIFDGERSALRRRAIFPDYKANRKGERPPDATPQMARVKQICQAMGLKVIQCHEYETDDAIATLAVKYARAGREVNIISRDKDFRQLLTNDNIFVFDPQEKKHYAKRNAGDKWGVQAHQIIDLLVLAGDVTDNIPGVDGFGEPTAAKWLNKYGSIGNMVQNAVLGNMTPALSKKLIEAANSKWLDKMRELVRFDENVNLGLTIKDLRFEGINKEALRPIYEELEFGSLL